MPFAEARKIAEEAKAEFRFDEEAQSPWYQERGKAEELLHDYFLGLKLGEKPRSFETFQSRKN